MGKGTPRVARNWLAAAVLAFAVPFGAATAQAAGNAATASGSAQATVIAPISAVEIADLDFGAVASNAARGGTVTVTAGAGAASYSGGARNSCNGAGCPAAHAALFTVSGEANRSYAVWTPASVTIAGAPLTVTGINVRTDSRPAAGPHGQLDANGADRFGVGGILQVPAGTGSAHYRVSVPVILNYS